MTDHASRDRRRTAAAIGTAQTLAWASSYYLPAILADPMARDLGVTPSWIFGAFSVALLVSAALGPLVGRIIDQRGGRPVLLASNLVFVSGLATLAWSPNAWTLATAWTIMGAAMAMGLYDAAFATLARLFGHEARGAITGVTLMAGFASTVGWPMTSYFNATLGWRGTCLVWAGLHLIVALPTYGLFVPRAGRSIPRPHADQVANPAVRPSPLLIGLLAYVFAAGWFVATCMAAHLPRVLEAAGASASVAVLAGALIGPAQVTARLIEFGLMHRSHPLASARVAVVLHPIGAFLFAVVGMPAALFAILHGAGNGLITIAVGTLPLALFGPSGYGFRQGLLGTPARIAQATAPLVFAVMLDRLGVHVLWITSGLLIAAFAALMYLGIAVRRSYGA